MPAIPVPLLFPILADANDFEDLCVDLLRLYWNRPKLERFYCVSCHLFLRFHERHSGSGWNRESAHLNFRLSRILETAGLLTYQESADEGKTHHREWTWWMVSNNFLGGPPLSTKALIRAASARCLSVSES